MKRPNADRGGQSIRDSVVLGDVYLLSHVDGPVTFAASSSLPYRVATFVETVAALAPPTARAQPSRLLLARYGVARFLGRAVELREISAWMEQDVPASVSLLHAGGGHGKTRLSIEVAAQARRSGWTVWRASHETPPAGSNARLPAPAERLLVIVDYADRWPPSDLLRLVTSLREVAEHAGTTVRVLLLARTASHWWAALSSNLESSIGTEIVTRRLQPLGDCVDRSELFRAAVDDFGAAMGVDDTGGLVPPADLYLPAYRSVLTIQMAALVAVDAHRARAQAPSGPPALSVYLLRREFAHWRSLTALPDAEIQTPANTLRRAAYLAALLGPLPRVEARLVLQQVGLADNRASADQIIDDHLRCYPAEDARDVLQGFRPDRLCEDFVALETPGHAYTDESGWVADDWTLTAPDTVLNDTGSSWTASAFRTLVEAAQRWPHVTDVVLSPLLHRRPEVAVAAGGAAMLRLADLDRLSPDILVAIDQHLPDQAHADLDVAAAAISHKTYDHRLATARDDVARANIHAAHADRLARAGRSREALDPATKAVSLRERLSEADPSSHLPAFAESLHDLALRLSELGKWETAVRACL
jgi:hypothetical protein